MKNGMTRVAYDALVAEYPGASVERCRAIIAQLLEYVPIYGYADYDPSFGGERICVCGHQYYRHFDSYDEMSPVGCKYCPCDTFVENDIEQWLKLNPDCEVPCPEHDE